MVRAHGDRLAAGAEEAEADALKAARGTAGRDRTDVGPWSVEERAAGLTWQSRLSVHCAHGMERH
jgi:hypothetical protein